MAEISCTARQNIHKGSDLEAVIFFYSFFFGDQTQPLADFDLHNDGKLPEQI